MNRNRDRLQLKASELPAEIDADLGTSAKIGEAIAAAQIVATERAYDLRYSQGINNFLHSQASTETLEQCEKLGGNLAALQLEERRRTLIEVSGGASAIGTPPYVLATLVGLDPLKATVIYIPAFIAALWLKASLSRTNGNPQHGDKAISDI